MNYLLPERLDRLAREYALGTLHGGARRRFERVLREQPASMRALGAWQEHFAALAAAVPPRCRRWRPAPPSGTGWSSGCSHPCGGAKAWSPG